MTGIERLREFTEARPSLLTCDQIEELRDITGQIEREEVRSRGLVYADRGGLLREISDLKSAIMWVVSDMEYNVPTAEVVKNVPVTKWMVKLRKALRGRAHDRAADASMCAYDLLPEEDRRAIALVRDSGGLDAVCEAVDFFEGMHDGLYTIDATERHTGDEMIREVFGWCRRLMPEGMEWPHYDTEELVDLGCEVARDDGMPAFVDKVVLTGDRWQLFDRYGCEINEEPMGPGERLTRPVRAISAEGEEIRADSDVWWICEGDERGVHAERLHVESIGPTGLAECSPHNGGTWVHLEPSELYVNEPVPAADGRPLREGETTWDVGGHGPLTVRRLPGKCGETVTLEKDGTFYYRYAERLTHERPDSFALIEQDVELSPFEYAERHGRLEGMDCTKFQRMDLVRRARLVWERDA